MKELKSTEGEGRNGRGVEEEKETGSRSRVFYVNFFVPKYQKHQS